MEPVTLVSALLILVGLAGIVIPVLPGMIIIWGAVLLWAVETQTGVGWTVLALSTVLALGGWVVQYLVPGRRLRDAGVGTWTMLAGVGLGVVGFFVVPVVGAFAGFVLGILLVELAKRRSVAAAWPATKHALKAVAMSVGIELLAGLAVATTFAVGVVAS